MLARETAVDLSPLIAEKDLDFELEGEKILVMGHPWMIGELISNLLHNAIRHTPVHGKLGIRISAREDVAELLIWDSGEGIDDQAMENVFKAFSSNVSSAGGLGLTICGEIVDSMQATISLRNRIGKEGAVEGLDALVHFRSVAG
jgi:two-component system sensor histidine kinase TctE